MTIDPAETLTIGGAAGTGPGTITVGTLLNTGASTVINPTGTLSGGSIVNFGGDVLIDEGELDLAPGSTMTLASSSTITALVVNTASTLTSESIAMGTVSNASLSIDGAGSSLVQIPGHTLTIGNSGISTATVSLTNDALMETSDGLTTINNTGLVDLLTGATLNVHGDLLIDGGTLNINSPNFTIDPGATVTISNNGLFLTDALFYTIGNGMYYDLQSGGTFQQIGDLSLDATGTLHLDGGTATLGNLDQNGGALEFIAGSLNIGGDFTLDDDLTFNDSRTLSVGGTMTVLGPTNVIVSGGVLNLFALNLDMFSLLDYQGGTLSVTGPVLASTGSLIDASGGSFALGDATAFNGFYTNGMLDTHDNDITLHDANAAIFDSGAFVLMGEAGSPGSLTAPNGLTLDFGGTVMGYGSIVTPDNPATPLINNGHINGTFGGGGDADSPITLPGYVKGVGTFDIVTFSGTFAPGFSPASINLGSVSYAGTLHIEIGGPTPGSDHDQLNHVLGNGIATLGGTLELSLLNNFMPTTGQEFIVMTATSVIGQFDQVIGPNNLKVEYQLDRVIVRGVCPADVTGDDNTVNVEDLLTLLGAWGPCLAPCPADIDGNDIVNVEDLLTLLGAWGGCS
ncbi:MAG: hypothetical protein O7G85_15020 [Planctomycetota bacterium]|nr:hypothetical protein [Planctomycetota bacterium]